jgi:hypothetical protein
MRAVEVHTVEAAMLMRKQMMASLTIQLMRLQGRPISVAARWWLSIQRHGLLMRPHACCTLCRLGSATSPRALT